MGASSLIFADPIEVLSWDPALGVSARFTPVGGGPVDCRVVIARADPDVGITKIGIRNPAWCALLPQSAASEQPPSGSLLEILDGSWTGTYVIHSTREDSFSPSWALELGAQAP